MSELILEVKKSLVNNVSGSTEDKILRDVTLSTFFLVSRFVKLPRISRTTYDIRFLVSY